MMKQLLRPLLFLFLACGPVAAEAPINAFFGPPARESDEGLDDHFIRFARSAKKTLDCAFYEIRMQSLVDAIVAAKKRGVKVRYVADDLNYYQRNDGSAETLRLISPFIQQLRKAGVEVVRDTRKGAIMHNKFAIADGKRVWTGSYNLTDTCSFRNDNNGLWIEDADIAATFTAEFEEMFTDKLFGPTSPTPGRFRKEFGKDWIEVLFAPEDDPIARIREVIAGAKQEVAFMQFAFTDNGLSDLLIEKQKAGLEVGGIFDRLLYRSTGPYGEFAKLSGAGIPVVVANSLGKFHHKVFVIDPFGEDPTVIVGSENASINGNNSNDENVVIIRSQTITRHFHRIFEKRRGELSLVTAEAILSEPAVTGGRVSFADLVINTNGRPVDTVRIEFPARWPVEGMGRDMEIFRGSQAMTLPAARQRIEGHTLILEDLALTGSGPASWLTVRFKSMPVPEIPGQYTPRVEVVHSSDPGQVLPLTLQPVINVLSSDAPDLIVGVIAHLRETFRRAGGLEHLPAEETNVFQSRDANGFYKARSIIIEAARRGKLEPFRAFLMMLRGLDAAELAALQGIVSEARELRRLLNGLIRDGNTEARPLLEELERGVRSFHAAF